MIPAVKGFCVCFLGSFSNAFVIQNCSEWECDREVSQLFLNTQYFLFHGWMGKCFGVVVLTIETGKKTPLIQTKTCYSWLFFHPLKWNIATFQNEKSEWNFKKKRHLNFKWQWVKYNVTLFLLVKRGENILVFQILYLPKMPFQVYRIVCCWLSDNV